MTDGASGLIPREQVRHRAARFFVAEQLEMHGFYGGWLEQAWATRVVTQDGREFRESWLFHLAADDEEGVVQEPGIAVEVIARVPFDIPSAGPVVIQDRTFSSGDLAPAAWVERALGSTVRPPGTEDEPIRKVMHDETFWELIGLLSGRLDEGAVNRLVEVLRPWEYGEQIAFQEAFDRKLFALDRPEDVVPYGEDPDLIDGEASLMYRCEIIAAGREVFERQLARPRRGTPGMDGRSTPEILYVLEEVSPYGMPRKSVPITTGSNPEYWSDAPPLPQPAATAPPEVPSPSPFSQRVQLETLGLEPRAYGAMFGFLAYATTEDCVREIVGCVMGTSVSAARQEVGQFLRAGVGDARLHDGFVMTPQGSGPVHGIELVEIERRGDYSLAQYVNRFIVPTNSREL